MDNNNIIVCSPHVMEFSTLADKQVERINNKRNTAIESSITFKSISVRKKYPGHDAVYSIDLRIVHFTKHYIDSGFLKNKGFVAINRQVSIILLRFNLFIAI